MSKKLEIAAINIQWPWSQLILSGQKTVETRNYRLPPRYVNQDLAIIETPGPEMSGEKPNEAHVVGTVRFSGCFKYQSFLEWSEDFHRHRVHENHPFFAYGLDDREKWGWVIEHIYPLDKPQPAPKKKGISFTKRCTIDLPRGVELGSNIFV